MTEKGDILLRLYRCKEAASREAQLQLSRDNHLGAGLHAWYAEVLGEAIGEIEFLRRAGGIKGYEP